MNECNYSTYACVCVFLFVCGKSEDRHFYCSTVELDNVRMSRYLYVSKSVDAFVVASLSSAREKDSLF